MGVAWRYACTSGKYLLSLTWLGDSSAQRCPGFSVSRSCLRHMGRVAQVAQKLRMDILGLRADQLKT